MGRFQFLEGQALQKLVACDPWQTISGALACAIGHRKNSGQP